MKSQFVLIICILVFGFAGHAFNFNYSESSDPRESYLYQALNEAFDIDALSGDNPFILYAGGHNSYPWVMVIPENNCFVIYSGILNNECQMLSQFKESKSNEILRSAFNDMIIICPECKIFDKPDADILSFGLIYADSQKNILFKYDTKWAYRDRKCEDNIKKLLNYLMMNYYIGFRQ